MTRMVLARILAILLLLPMMAQSQDQPSTSTILWSVTQPNGSLQEEGHVFDDQVWCYLEFSEVPTDQQKEQLKRAGVQLYQYQPDLKWLVTLPQNTPPNLLAENGVKRAFVKPLYLRADQRILRGQVPSYAITGGEVEATIIVGATGEYAAMEEQLEALGLTVHSTFEPLGFIKVSGTEAELKATAQLPFVIYVELPEPPAELEIEDEMTNTRAPYINGYYNLDGLNGDGITIAVNEGGIVDTIYDPDFKNRLDRSLEAGNPSNHKTGVSWRMASAGNINPIHRGQAWGAELMSGGINFTNAAQASVNIVNNSFGYGCIPAGPTYNSGAATNDFLVRTYSRFMITYSCGNMGSSTCANYGAGPGWGNITGLIKSAKNIFAVGAMNVDDQLTGFSSRGPAMDGRILPDITATGPGGTSHATPNLAGVNAILTEAYRNENFNQWPGSDLIKAIILNTADDIENPGPDYKTGFGRVNARRALEVIEEGQYMTNIVANGAVQTNTVTVPANVSELKVSIYWNDREATAGITGKTLVNDLDLRVQPPGFAWVQPWVLNPFPHPDSLDLPAIQGTDTLNNVELVTIDNPVPGNYSVEVTGSLVPFGPQTYRIVYSFVYDSLTVIYPYGGEGLVPGESRRIRWDAFDSGDTFDLEYSIDDGDTWLPIVSGLASNLRNYNWTIPNTVSGECLVKVSAGNLEAESDDVFTIAYPPTNLNLVWRCADSAIVSWDSVAGADGYEVYLLDNKYMEDVDFADDPYIVLHNLSTTTTEWFSVQTILPDDGASRRAIAIAIPPGDFNCIGQDLSVDQIESPEAGYTPDCFLSDSLDLVLRLKNNGTTALTYLPIAYTLNGGAVMRDTLYETLVSADETEYELPAAIVLQAGTNTLKAWSEFPGDANNANDTIEIAIVGYPGTAATLPYTQDFDNFTNCATAWGCASITCNLTQGWFNLPNQLEGDSIDWRTHSGGTGSGGTGPSADHTSGSGKYLYLEGSGNGGSGCQNKMALLHSPCFDLDGTNTPTLSYWYHANGGAIGSLHVDVLSEGQWHLDVAQPIVGQQGNQWLQQTADLSAFEGEEVVVRFRGFTGGGWQADLALDDINLTTLPLADFETTMDTFCIGQNVPLQNLTTYGDSYAWSVLQNPFTYTSGNATSTNPTILPGDTGWYDVQLIATNATGSDTLILHDFFYVGDFTPEVISDAPGDVYCFDDHATFTVDGHAITYDFYYNGILVQSGPSDTWDTTGLNDGDSVWVQTVVNSQCGYTSPTLTVMVQPNLDGTPLWADDQDLTICEGDTVVFETVDGLDDYEFFVGGISVQFGPDSLYETDQLQDGDEVYVEITDSIGCSGITDTLFWTVNPIPATPQILVLGGDSLQSSVSASNYQWWYNGQLLPDNTQIIIAANSGLYTVQVSDLGCDSEVSQELDHTLVGLEQLETLGIRLYPNPTRDQVFLEVEDQAYHTLSLFDNTGRLVLTEGIITGVNVLNLGHLAAGMYIAKVSGEARELELKVLVK